ncbi:hypothetical protein CSQ96_09420 [Janthinobacterium sp. BJB412]|nr:hypothetical protein CSQ96_09420 [Janthinobacterium sp. BJB412]
MADTLLYRPATEADLDLLVETICEAEKGGTEVLSYCRIFDMTEAEFKPLLRGMLEEDIEGQELCVSGFMVAELNGRGVGAVCGWVEGASGQSSAILKASLLVHAIDGARMRAAQRHFKKLEKLYIMRETGAIQIESMYVSPAGRGRRLAAGLINAQIERYAAEAPVPRAQIILAGINDKAAAVYAGCGFVQIGRSASEDESLLEIVPSLEKLLIQRTFDGATA